MELDVLISSQPAWLVSSSTRSFNSRFQLCFDFAMHYGSFIVPLIFNHKDIKHPLTAVKKQLVSIKDWLTANKLFKCEKNKILILQ